jgi:FecR protein
MQILLRVFLSGAAFVGLLLLCLAPALAQVGIVRTVEGAVSVLSGKQECAPRYGLDLEEGDAVRTGAKAWALLTMIDGARVTVRPDSEVRVVIYRYVESGDSWQSRAVLALMRGAVRVSSGRIAVGRSSGFEIKTPDATMDVRGADSDITYIAVKPSSPGDAPVGTYGRAYAGEAVLKNAGGEVTVHDGQTAYAEPRVLPRVLTTAAAPYFYHWHHYIDRRAAAVAEKLELLVLP